MIRYFIDSSALAKAFLQEAGTASVLSLLEGTEDKARLYSALTPLEVLSAVRRKQTANEISASEAALALSALSEEMQRTEQMPLTQSLINIAEEVVDHFDLRAGDALQLGAAIQYSELHTAGNLVLVACDDRLLAAAVAVGLTKSNPITDNLPLEVS